MSEQAKSLEITCRNCSESFSLPEETLSQQDLPCPKCGFLNHTKKPGTFSRTNILAKLGHIVGNEAEVDEDIAYKARIKGGIALVLAISLAILYTLFNNQLF